MTPTSLADDDTQALRDPTCRTLHLILPATRILPPLRVGHVLVQSSVEEIARNAVALMLVDAGSQTIELQHVRARMRRNGFGSALLDAAKRDHTQLFVTAPSCITEFEPFFVENGFVSNRAVQGSVAGSAGGALVPNNLTLHLAWQANARKRLSRRA